MGYIKYWANTNTGQKIRKETLNIKNNIQLWRKNGQQKEQNECIVKEKTKKNKEKQMQGKKFECGKDRDDFLTEA